MSFKDIKGQDKVIEFLKNSIANNKVSHAYVFFGPGGIGKRTTAINFAKALNCLSASGGTPCDECPSCKKIDSLGHPDVHLIKSDKEGGSIKIERVRELIASASLKPYEGRTKVYIIDGAGSMTHEAQNALLKTLEEPPADAVIMLITENMDDLLSTVQSRAQVLKFFPMAITEVREILKRVYKVDDPRAHILSHLSSGRIGEALRYNDDDVFAKRSNVLRTLADRTFLNSDFDGLSKEDFRLYLDIMLTWYRDVLAAKAGIVEQSMFVNIDKKDQITREAKRSQFDELDEIIRQIILTNTFLEQNANPKLAMSVLGLKAMTTDGA